MDPTDAMPARGSSSEGSPRATMSRLQKLGWRSTEQSFTMLNMRSGKSDAFDDRTARARIRDAAIASFAKDGVAATSVRAIAAAAGVSPALIIHHFGSKDGLRYACDEHITAVIREGKYAAMAAGPAFDPLAALRSTAGDPPIGRYLARTLIDGSPHVRELVDEMVEDASGYMEAGVANQTLRPSAYPRERAAILTLWSLGALVLHEHMHRLLGVDLTAEPSTLAATPEGVAYFGAVLELFADGLLGEAMTAHLRDTLLADRDTKRSRSDASAHGEESP